MNKSGKNLTHFLLKPLRNQRGMALLMAIMAIILMTFIAMEVSYDTNVEYIVAAQQVNRLKAYYAARSGVEISLLRILIYKKAIASFGSQLGSNKAMLDPIWSFPFSWPPILPDEMSSVDRDMIQSVIKESDMDAQYLATIEAEGGKIDINDLGSPIESLRLATKAQILKIFETQLENDEEFSKNMMGFNFDELINNMMDWIDEDEESLNGGPESGYYRENTSEFIPSNQPFKTMQEIHMVAGMTDDIYNLLAPRITVFGTKGININYASKEVLMGLDVSITDEVAGLLIERRNTPDQGGPYQNEQDFFTYAQSLGVNTEAIENTGIPLIFDAEYNFTIRSTGQFANVIREIKVVTYDYENLTERYIKLMEEDEKASSDGNNAKAPETPQTSDDQDEDEADEPKIKVPKGRPTIVSWEEN